MSRSQALRVARSRRVPTWTRLIEAATDPALWATAVAVLVVILGGLVVVK